MKIKKCKYCDETSNKTRDGAVDDGWFFADIRAPIRKYLIACPKHYLEMYDELNGVFGKEI